MQMAARIICCKFWSNTWVFTSNWLHWTVQMTFLAKFTIFSFLRWIFLSRTLNVLNNVFRRGLGNMITTEMHWMHLCSLSRLSVTKDTLWEVMNTSLKCHNVGDVRKTTPRVSPSQLSDPCKARPRVAVEQHFQSLALVSENWGEKRRNSVSDFQYWLTNSLKC